MITIKNSEFKKGLNKTNAISGKNILPVLDYIKLDFKNDRCTLTKTVFDSFIVADIEADFKKDGSLLLDIEKTSSFVNSSEGEETTISVKKDRVILDDGFTNAWFPLADVKHYPVVESNSECEKFELTKQVIDVLKQASKHAMPIRDKETRVWQTFTHTKTISDKNYVIGFGESIVFAKEVVTDKWPQMSVDPKVISMIGSLPSVEYSATDNYDFFESVGILYGFRKYETICPVVKEVLDRFVSEESFEINRDSFVLFCELVSGQHKSSLSAVIEVSDSGKDEVLLKYEPYSGDGGAEKKIKVKNKTYNLDKTYYSPNLFLTVLKNIDHSDEIKISKIKGFNVINILGEDDYVGAVSETFYNQK